MTDKTGHGKIDINLLQPETKEYLMCLMNAIRVEPGILKAQVTFDFEPDQPPTVHVITMPCDHEDGESHVTEGPGETGATTSSCAPYRWGLIND